jgi:hypothetical protein
VFGAANSRASLHCWAGYVHGGGICILYGGCLRAGGFCGVQALHQPLWPHWGPLAVVERWYTALLNVLLQAVQLT